MNRHRKLLPASATVAALAITGSLVVGAPTASGAAPSHETSQPSAREKLPPTELLGENGPPVPLKNQAQIVVSEFGLRFMAGQQHSRLTITEVGNKVRYVDTGTQRWRKLPKVCKRQQVARGIAALCRLPRQFRNERTTFLEVWPRLGNDVINGASVSNRYRLWVLADKGRDVVTTGAGRDFVNGAQNNDTVAGGAGNDWLRTGKGSDRVSGGPGNDKLVSGEANDVVYGGPGSDQMFGGPGSDIAYADASDQVYEFEQRRAE